MSERTCHIAEQILTDGNVHLRAAVGFDGYIDELLRVVEKGDIASGYTFYRDIASFAARVAQAAGKSSDLEIVPTGIKLGGNAPIMANALARMGVQTACIGAMGYPKLHEVFMEMAGRCECVSLCNPAYTHALEFQDGKVMLANAQSLEQLTWERMKNLLGLERMSSLLEPAEVIALVNWSGVSSAADIWAGIHRELLPGMAGRGRRFFFDLADSSRKSEKDISSVLEQIQAYMEYGQVFLGLNENEALRIGAAIGEKENNLKAVGQAIYERLPITAILIHPVDCCIAVTGDGISMERGTVVEQPCISTGGGDNFNAGFCLGQMLGLELSDSMILGMAVSGFYVENGYSPNLCELAERLR